MVNVLLVIAFIVGLLAAALHVYIFYMESIAWAAPPTWKRFGIKSQDEANTVRPMAFNQGFYNLFLAIGVVVGFILALSLPSQPLVGISVALFAVGSMLAAALVLILSSPKLARAAITQGTLPLISVIFFVIGIVVALNTTVTTVVS